jgi:hypothetical protein
MEEVVIEKIEWIRGQIGLRWKCEEVGEELDQDGYDYNRQKTTTFSTETCQGINIVLQQEGHFWLRSSRDFWDDTSYTNRSTCFYKLQINPKNETGFAYGSKGIESDEQKGRVESELEHLFYYICQEPRKL